jgi:phosphoribosylanthranilate isomerase
MWIKICGITRLEDALSAARFGADAVGFVFADSPRRVSPVQARDIAGEMPGRPARVGVFVDSPPEEVLRIAEYCGLDLVQLHGNEDAEYCDALGDRAIKALRVAEKADLLKVRDYRCRAVLLDGYAKTTNSGNGNGGGGAGIDWKMLRVIKSGRPVIVAGGLQPGNVAAAVKETHPYGVDVSSGVESAPGIKDPVLMYEFIERARKADYEVNDN